MGLRDRLRLLVRPPAVVEVPRPAPRESPSPPAPPAVRIPRRVVSPPLGARVIDVAVVPQAEWATLRGAVTFVSADGGRAASAAAERTASFGLADVSWVAGGGA